MAEIKKRTSSEKALKQLGYCFPRRINKVIVTIDAVLLVTNPDEGKLVLMAVIGPLCVCPSKLWMSLGREAVEPTAWFRRTWIASSSLSKRSSIRDWKRTEMENKGRERMTALLKRNTALNYTTAIQNGTKN